MRENVTNDVYQVIKQCRIKQPPVCMKKVCNNPLFVWTKCVCSSVQAVSLFRIKKMIHRSSEELKVLGKSSNFKNGCVLRCRRLSKPQKNNPNWSFFHIPRDKSAASTWIVNMKKIDLLKTIYLCEEHFESNCLDEVKGKLIFGKTLSHWPSTLVNFPQFFPPIRFYVYCTRSKVDDNSTSLKPT